MRSRRARSLRLKALVILILVGVLPQLVIGLVERRITQRYVVEQARVTAGRALDHLVFTMSRELQSYINLTVAAATNPRIVSALSRPAPAGREAIFSLIRSEIFSREKLSSVNYPAQYLLIAGDGTIYTDLTFIRPDSPSFDTSRLRSSAWYGALRSARSPELRVVNAPNYLYPYGGDTLYFVRSIVSDWENLGVVAVGLNLSSVSRLLDALKPDEAAGIYLLDELGRPVTRAGTNYPGSAALEDDRVGTEGDPEEVRAVRLEGRRYLMLTRRFSFPESGQGFRLLTLTPEASIYRSLNAVRAASFSLLVLAVAAVALLVLIIQKQFIRPIITLNQAVRRVQGGNFEAECVVQRNDEIGELSESFNHMVIRLRDHIRDIHRAEEAKRALELRVLQSQLKPHFIRNTLNTIRWMAQLRGARTISTAIASFVRMQDYLLASAEELVPVREELDYLEQYLYLQKIRWQNKLSVRLEVGEEVRGLGIPKLIFLPIVENAISHGIAPRKAPGHLSIEGRLEGGRVVFAFHDDGVGMRPETLQTLVARLRLIPEENDVHGIGLTNVQKRVHHYFGPEYGLTVESRRDEGTTVRLSLPRIPAPPRGRKEEVLYETADRG